MTTTAENTCASPRCVIIKGTTRIDPYPYARSPSGYYFDTVGRPKVSQHAIKETISAKPWRAGKFSIRNKPRTLECSQWHDLEESPPDFIKPQQFSALMPLENAIISQQFPSDDGDANNIPDEFIDPFSLMPIKIAVMLPDISNKFYDKSTMIKWLTHTPRHPYLDQALTIEELLEHNSQKHIIAQLNTFYFNVAQFYTKKTGEQPRKN